MPYSKNLMGERVLTNGKDCYRKDSKQVAVTR